MRVLAVVTLMCALLGAGGCAEDSPSNGGSDDTGAQAERDQPGLPPGSYTWVLIRKGSSNAQCGEQTCPAPTWAGAFDVAADGAISGTGELGHDLGRPGKVLPYEDMVCTGGGGEIDSILPEQDVMVSGTVPAEGKATLRLEFDAEVVRGEKRLADCPKDTFGTLADKWEGLEPLLMRGETRTVAMRGKEGETLVDVQGMRYVFYW